MIERFELVRDSQGWLALVHCDCGSTLTSGHVLEPGDAVFIARRQLEEHRARGFDGCGTGRQSEVDCKCDACRSHNRFLAKIVAVTL